MEVIYEIASDIAEYSTSTDDTVWSLAVKGPPGSGKSLFTRALLIEVISSSAKILAERNRLNLEQA